VQHAGRTRQAGDSSSRDVSLGVVTPPLDEGNKIRLGFPDLAFLGDAV